MQVRPNPEPDGLQPGALKRFRCRNRAPIGHKALAQRLTLVNEEIPLRFQLAQRMSVSRFTPDM